MSQSSILRKSHLWHEKVDPRNAQSLQEDEEQENLPTSVFDGGRRDLDDDKGAEPLRERAYGGTDVPESKRRDLRCVDPRYGAPGHSNRKLEQYQHG